MDDESLEPWISDRTLQLRANLEMLLANPLATYGDILDAGTAAIASAMNDTMTYEEMLECIRKAKDGT